MMGLGNSLGGGVLGKIRNVKDGGGLWRARQIAWEDLGDSPVRRALEGNERP